jgi:hypothetical protein
MRLLTKALVVAALAGGWSCSGDEPQEAVQPAGGEGSVAVPDTPGDPGETAEKPAGEGLANGTPEEAASQAAAAQKEAKASTGDRVVAGASAVNVRSGPGMSHGVVRVVKQGEKVAVVECAKGWCKLAEGEFVAGKFLETPAK